MAAKSPFPGFSSQMHTFFRGLEKNNERDWFNPRKSLFEEHVRTPMIELVTQINDDLRSFAADNCVRDPGRAIYRIYRDTRFSKDKTPYKTHIGATFPRGGLPKHCGAGFYFGVSNRCVELAGGVYMPGPEELATLRSAIVADAKGFLKLISDRKLTSVMGELMGEKLVRLPKSHQDCADSPAAPYLCFKQYYWFVELPAKVALTSAIRKEVVSRFRLMAPALAWMNQVLLAARKEDEEEARPARPEPMW